MSVSASTPPNGRDERSLPWQFPNRTEQSAAERHRHSQENYLAVPWATHIDREVPWALDKKTTASATQIWSELHTVCQHVYWDEATHYWTAAGVTDVWLSHAADPGLRPGRQRSVSNMREYPWRIHAWPLYAVNVEDPERRAGIIIRKSLRSKRYLASFVGTHMDHYISDSRLLLPQLNKNPSFHIEINSRKWHFYGPTWQHQVEGRPLNEVYQISAEVQRYNEILSNSVFILCPAGAGRNTIRLWEALAVGAIPVLLDEAPLLPQGGSLPPIQWSEIVIQFTKRDIPNLPLLLRKIPTSEIIHRSSLATQAYAQMQTMSCSCILPARPSSHRQLP